jgi:hypothetical protein
LAKSRSQFAGEEELAFLEQRNPQLLITFAHFCRTACLLITLLAQYSDLLRLFPSMAMELVMDVVQCLKLFNSRTCQLILGAGARQLVGLKTITVKHLGEYFLFFRSFLLYHLHIFA